MASGWRKARIALGLNVCVRGNPDDDDDGDESSSNNSDRTTSQAAAAAAAGAGAASPSPRSGSQSSSMRSPSRFQLIRNSIRLSRSNTCSICLEHMKPGTGHALFTAECSHTFHFSCIASNVRHGNLVCPVCRSRWNEVPWQAPAAESSKDDKASSSPRPRGSLSTRQHESQEQPAGENPEDDELQLRRLDPVLRILDESIANARGVRRSVVPEPHAFDDDEALSPSSGKQPDLNQRVEDGSLLEIRCHPEVGSVCYSQAREELTVLVHVKARESPASLGSGGSSSRAPVDLVTVLDVSGSMAGNKLVLLKQAMGFVVRNLSPADRLSVIAFSSSAKRLFPLRRMGEENKQLALRAIDSLISTGGTNIAEGLSKGARVLEDRRERNPIASIMLLSDGQDTHTVGGAARGNPHLSRGTGSFRRSSGRHAAAILMPGGSVPFPVHTFGFGADHDAATMHSIAENSGGTFSFIQAEAAVQDAFAQCIGGLLSVVIQDAQLQFSTPGPRGPIIRSIQAGSYERAITHQGTRAGVKLKDLYAEEERDVLLEISLPALESPEMESVILSVECVFRDPVSQKLTATGTSSMGISRPESNPEDDHHQQEVSVEVDRQRNRIRAAQTILEAGCLADRGDLSGAQEALQNAKLALRNSAAARAGDQLSGALDSELTEIQVRMANRQMYERSGRAYVLSSQSSHFRQRATARGDYVESHSRDYQTPSMVDMILRSQTLTFPIPGDGGTPAAAGDRSTSRSLSSGSCRRASGRVHDVGSST